MNRTVRSLVALLCLSGVVVLGVGCSSKAPKEANAALDAALGALPKGQTQTFVDTVVTDQRAGVEKLPEWPFFTHVKSYKIENEFDLDVTSDSALIMASLYFDDQQKHFASVYFVMKKADGKWRIDLTDTIKRERDADGAQAFNVWEFKKTPG